MALQGSDDITRETTVYNSHLKNEFTEVNCVICVMVHNWTTQEHENIKQFVSVIKILLILSDLWRVGGFLWVHRFPPPIKLTTTI